MDRLLDELTEEIEAPAGGSWRSQLRMVRALRAAIGEWEIALLMAARSGADAASWTELSDDLGMTRQAAWQRFASEADRPESAQHRLLKGRIDALIAELETETATLELSGLHPDDVASHRQGSEDELKKRFRELVNEHIRQCDIAGLERWL